MFPIKYTHFQTNMECLTMKWHIERVKSQYIQEAILLKINFPFDLPSRFYTTFNWARSYIKHYLFSNVK